MTDGRLDEAYRAIHFEETFIWDNGEQDAWRWAMTRGMDGRYMAAEARAGAGIQSRYDGFDYVLSFRRSLTEDGRSRARYVTRFTQVSARVALKRVRLFIWGLPVGELTAFHRQVD